MSAQEVLLPALGVFVGVLMLLLLHKAVGQLLALLVRTALGAGVLAAFTPLGNLIGVQLGVNVYNALVLGVLGVPGMGLLLMLSWLVR